MHLERAKHIQSQSVVPRSDACVDEGCIGVDVGHDASTPHVCYQRQSLAYLLTLSTQTDDCNTLP